MYEWLLLYRRARQIAEYERYMDEWTRSQEYQILFDEWLDEVDSLRIPASNFGAPLINEKSSGMEI